MTDFQISPGGLYVPVGAADGAYLAHKDGVRFAEFLRLTDGENTTVNLGDGTVQIDAAPSGVTSIVAGTGITVDATTDPTAPVVSALVPMTTINESGIPEIVFDSDGDIVYTEGP